METSLFNSLAFEQLKSLSSNTQEEVVNLSHLYNEYSKEDFGIREITNSSIRQKSGMKLLRFNILSTYKIINPSFSYDEPNNSRLPLTIPAEGIFNDGKDNCDYNLIVYTQDEFLSKKTKYTVHNFLGQGISGQVFEVSDNENNVFAMKVIKNNPSYKNQAIIELKIVNMLNTTIDKNDVYHIIRMNDYFMHKEHLCIVFELLNENLYQLLENNHLQGISLNSIQFIIKQILEAIEQIHKANIIHCDIKPENILLKINKEKSNSKISIKVTDFGSSCKRGSPMFSYIQSRYYRAPEVLLGSTYSSEIDIWSIGLIAAELYLGNPLLPGSCAYDQLKKIESLLGDIPQHLLKGKKVTQFYKIDFEQMKMVLKNDKDYYKEIPKDQEDYYPIPFDIQALDDLLNIKKESKIRKYSNANRSSFHNTSNSSMTYNDYLESFIHFLKGLLALDPKVRWNATQCLKHPFITKERLDSFTMISNHEEHPIHLSSEQGTGSINNNNSFTSIGYNISTNSSMSLDMTNSPSPLNNNNNKSANFFYQSSINNGNSIHSINNGVKSLSHAKDDQGDYNDNYHRDHNRQSTMSTIGQKDQNISGIMDYCNIISCNNNNQGNIKNNNKKSKFSTQHKYNSQSFKRITKRGNTIQYPLNKNTNEISLFINSNWLISPFPYITNHYEDYTTISRPSIPGGGIGIKENMNKTGVDLSINQSYDTENIKLSQDSKIQYSKSIANEENYELIFDNK